MIKYEEFAELLKKYNIDEKKILEKNRKALKRVNYKEVEDILDYLKNIKISSKSIENYPGILWERTVETIKNNYELLIGKPAIEKSDIEKNLEILNSELNELEMEKIYEFILVKYGEKVLKDCLLILTENYDDIVNLTTILENTIGLNIIKNNGSNILIETTSDKFEKILKIPEFKYNPETKTYNEFLLVPNTFKRSYEEIKDILALPFWSKPEYQSLLAPNIWNKDAIEITEILNLPYWKEPRFQHLLGPSIWNTNKQKIDEILGLSYNENGEEKSYWDNPIFHQLLTTNIWNTSKDKLKDILSLKEYWERPEFVPLLTPTILKKDINQIKDILKLKEWEDPKFQPLLTSSVWHKDAKQIKAILKLKFWEDSKFHKLLTPSVWHKDVNQITDILSLSYWNDPKFIPLLTPTIWDKNAEQITDILSLSYIENGESKSYWENPKFIQLLRPTIWKKNAEQIKAILSLPFWQDDRFQTLLTPSIWNQTADNITKKIDICMKNGLEAYANNPTLILRLTPNELLAKINYLKATGKDLYSETGKINPIFGMSNEKMKKHPEYGISNKELIKGYLHMEVKTNVL